ncbi:MAG: PhoX family protein [Burkholderiales bacterium]
MSTTHAQDSAPLPPPTNSLDDLLSRNVSRRQVLRAGVAGIAGLLPIGCAVQGGGSDTLIGFASVPTSWDDKLTIPPGYRSQVLYAWGDATGVQGQPMPAFRWDGSNSAADQALQAGMNHDAIEYFALPPGSKSSTSALFAINHEYIDDGLLHADGMTTWNAEKVAKAQASHGVSVIEVAQRGNRWEVVRPSQYARRITARTPMTLSGPAAGHESLRTAADPLGREVLGTINNCAGGYTPWGTYLTCEENFNMYFANAGTIPPEQRRYGIGASSVYRWNEFDARFDAGAHPNEPNRFGWVVEIDPYDREWKPVKRTAMGRIKHEGAMVTIALDGRIVVYTGDDERFEYIYKFVSAKPWNPQDRAANRDLLDAGTLFVAKFSEQGQGAWIGLTHGKNGLTAANGFNTQADVLIKTRQAADTVGATKMDRPEWVAVHPVTQDVYLALTNNALRGTDKQPGVDAANPRPRNAYGHIVRWREQGGDVSAHKFRWEHFVLAGDTQSTDAAGRGTVKGDSFGSPDGLWFDARGLLWIQTDVAAADLRRPEYARIGNNQMLAADVFTGEIRRFLVGPKDCELTGVTMSPDGKTMFVNIQHPGELPGSPRNDPAKPRAGSNWPDFRADGRPRSATVVIQRQDGGVIGT